MSVAHSPETKEKFDRLIQQYPNPRAALLAALHLAQEEFGYISQPVEEYLADLLQLAPVAVKEVVSFYTLLHTTQPGNHVLRICRNLSCHLSGGEEIQAHIERRLGIRVGETSPDGKFTLLPSECLGACESAPMMQLDGAYYGPLTPEYIDEILASLISEG
jgi:NADH-quinone oxidoreductase E subunit